MRITYHTDYALRVLVYLALHPQQRATVGEIANAYDLSRHHLLKVAQTLRKQHLVEAVRGRGGGLRLSKPPAHINVGALVRATEEDFGLVECMGKGECRISPVCRLKGVFAEALTSFMDILDRYSLADVAGNRAELAPLLGLDGGMEMTRRKAAAK